MFLLFISDDSLGPSVRKVQVTQFSRSIRERKKKDPPCSFFL